MSGVILPASNNTSSANVSLGYHEISNGSMSQGLGFSNSSQGDSIAYSEKIQTPDGAKKGFTASRGNGEVASQTSDGHGIVKENGKTVDLSSNGDVNVQDQNGKTTKLGNIHQDPSLLQKLQKDGTLDAQGVKDLQGVQKDGLNSLDFVQKDFAMDQRAAITKLGSVGTGGATMVANEAGQSTTFR